MSGQKIPWNTNKVAILYAFLAALLFGINAPFSKLLVAKLDPLFLASLLYLGAGFGMLMIDLVRRKKRTALCGADDPPGYSGPYFFNDRH
jgi:drug/metabolite transporter (DMT)-like permease